MHPAVRAFWLPKAGNTNDEYEDAYWPSANMETAVPVLPLHLAVADGATEASFSGLWARQLVESFGAGEMDADGVLNQLPQLKKIWQSEVGNLILPWYAEEKRRQGAFAAFVGIRIDWEADKGFGVYTAIAVGDSCLFHLRDDRLVSSFPVDHSDEFSSRPILISSVIDDQDTPTNYEKHATGEWRQGDTFYLMTDALACWFLSQIERGGDYQSITEVDSIGAFENLIHLLRTTKNDDGTPSLKNDDVTLIRFVAKFDAAE